jgi:hypothetical protein
MRLARALWKSLRARLRGAHEDESGMVMTEFAIAFPAQLFVTLAIMQFALILVAHVFVEHAAFAGARAALVADVPLSGGASTGSNVQALEQAAAMRAACFVLNPIAPGSDIVSGSGASNPSAIHFASGDRSAGAFAQTKVTCTDQDGYIAVTVQHDYVMQIPMVNHWFALANPKSFWYGPGADNASGKSAYNQASQNGYTCLRIVKNVFLPRPWKAF